MCAKAPTGARKSTLRTLCWSKLLIQPKNVMSSFKAYPSTVAPREANRAKPRAVKVSANAGFCQRPGAWEEEVGRAVLVAKGCP